jgi:hypothetical protein
LGLDQPRSVRRLLLFLLEFVIAGVARGRLRGAWRLCRRQAGAAGNSSRGVVEIDVLDHTKVEGDIGADSNGRVGVKMEWDY